MHPEPTWKVSRERGQDRSVGPVRPGTSDLTAQYRHLMPKHENLRFLGVVVAASQQHQPARTPNKDQI
jgi:hypothetical protein